MSLNEFLELRTIPAEQESVLIELDRKREEYAATFPGEEEMRRTEFDTILEYLRDLKSLRDERARNPASYNIPTRTVDTLDSKRVMDRLMALERTYGPDGTKASYLVGSAVEDDEVRVTSIVANPDFVTTGEHATDHATGSGELHSGRKIGGADWGVGGLSDLIAEEFGGISITMPGRQTGNGNGDPHHPFGDVLTSTISSTPSITASLQLHGASPGKVATLADDEPLDILIGVGAEPNDASLRAAELISDIAEELGLRAGINQKFIQFEEVRLSNGLVVVSPKPRKDGSAGLAYDNFRAAGANTTRSIAERAFTGVGREGVSLQLELASPLRVMPTNAEGYSDKTRAIGPYLAYLILKTYHEESAN
jgi:hypothetical protein